MTRWSTPVLVLAGCALLGGVVACRPLTCRAPLLGRVRPKLEPPLSVPLIEPHHVNFVVYFRSRGPSLPSERTLRQAALRWLDGHAPHSEVASLRGVLSGKLLELHFGPKKSLPPPPLHQLQHRETGAAELERLKAATHYALVSVKDRPGRLRHTGLRGAIAASRALAEQLSGVILDPVLGEVEPIASSMELLPSDVRPRITKHIVVTYSVDERGLGWMTTQGMSKFGLPELQIKEYPPDLSGDLCRIVNGVGRYLLTALAVQADRGPRSKVLRLGPEIRLTREEMAEAGEQPPHQRTSNTRGWTEIRLRYEPGRGDETPFLTLTSPSGFKGDHGVWLHSISSDLFGTEDPRQVRSIESENPAMIAAHDRAVAELPGVKRRFQAGLRPGETLLVKHGFPTRNGGHEYMWVVVNTWKGALIQGQLANDPVVRTDMRPGQKVHLYDSDVFDWMLDLPDGSDRGNYTGAVATAEGRTNQ
jgi:uncharacterized protein YegJ (DUF2314 family)